VAWQSLLLLLLLRQWLMVGKWWWCCCCCLLLLLLSFWGWLLLEPGIDGNIGSIGASLWVARQLVVNTVEL
jgi:hypothetical protein